jgi:hypothetical protein
LEIRPINEDDMRPQALAAKAGDARAALEIPLRPRLQRLTTRVNIIWGISR